MYSNNRIAKCSGPTVATEVAFGPESLARSKSEVKQIVDEVLERTGIAHLRDAYPPTLRRGEKQRVAIASALAMQSKILIPRRTNKWSRW